MITLEEYWMGRDKDYSLALDTQTRKNAALTVDYANKLLMLAKGAGITLNPKNNGSMTNSGWRPPAVNAATQGASKTSFHMTGLAIDLSDPKGTLDDWMLKNPNVLKDLGLWQEHPDATPGWAHVQLKPPKSGNRVFRP